MTNMHPQGVFGRLPTLLLLVAAVLIAALIIFAAPLSEWVRESRMQHISTAHYEILFPRGALSPEAVTAFSTQQERRFADLDKRLGQSESSAKIRIVLDPGFRGRESQPGAETAYSVDGTTIRARLSRPALALPEEADAEALLRAAWGKPGNPDTADWAAIWLVGDWQGTEIGMAAAEVEQKIGHQKLATLVAAPREIPSPDDRSLLGAAWLSEVAEFDGTDAVRKLYAAKMARPTVAEITEMLGTTPVELERKWQLWMYAYLAGMPAMPAGSNMPADMPMARGH